MPLSPRGSFQDHDTGLIVLDDDNSSGDSMSFDSGSMGSSSSRSQTNHKLNNSDRSKKREEVFGEQEGRIVSRTRFAFLSVLLMLAAALGTVVYLVLDQEAVEDFESQFTNLGNEVLEASNDKVMNALGVLGGVSTTITSFMLHENEMLEMAGRDRMPPGFATLPDIQQHFSTARNVTGALVIAYMPLVEPEHLELWNNYSQVNQGWIAKSNKVNEAAPILPSIFDYPEHDHRRQMEECKGRRRRTQMMNHDGHHGSHNMEEYIQSEDDERVPLTADQGPFAPVWTLCPPPLPNATDIINYNLFAKPVFQQAVDFIQQSRKPTFLDVFDQAKWFDNRNHADELQTVIAYPVFENFDENNQAKIVGHLAAIFPWRLFLEDILAQGTEPVAVVMENTCDEVFTFEVHEHEAVFVDESDVHDPEFDAMKLSQTFADFANPKEFMDDGSVCVYTITVYPTVEMQNNYDTNEPVIYAVVVLAAFLGTCFFFMIFDCFVQRRQARVMTTALKQNAIVSSLFPESIRDQMMAEVGLQDTSIRQKLANLGKAGLKSYLNDAQAGEQQEKKSSMDKSKPIADLFPATTIMFADIAGFTAWSSTREPSQVFTLLETIYHTFDAIAKRRRVFKVETVGDCYVAVTGLPDPRKDHAVVMAKFAHECVRKMSRLTRELEVALGPDTADLGLRAGLHSGPVVAGVLRGEKSRFQLFGDTMNTASRMESTGTPDRIQISQETAELLIKGRKGHWCVPREDKVKAKGKGELSTFWLEAGGGSDDRSVLSSDASIGSAMTLDEFDIRAATESKDKMNRIADWTVEILAMLLKEITTRRIASGVRNEDLSTLETRGTGKKNETVIHEVKEIIELPKFNAETARKDQQLDPSAVELTPEVLDELRDYVRTIASMYNDNPFHNFAHANHVTMSVTKLLSRIVAPDIDDANNRSLHDHTYGITSDPLTRFAVVFSALIHDVDHEGVSNMQLIKEKAEVAKLYNNKSVAEQNSVDLAWGLLMEPTYDNLRQQIYTTKAEFKRFRQLVVNTVMATDIMDKDLKKLRNDRWDAAFELKPDTKQAEIVAKHASNMKRGLEKSLSTMKLTSDDNNAKHKDVNRKATIVIEHLIQASDVAHTMQHWHIYRKWNERLFRELYKAFEEGRMEKDPSIDWYKGEIGFFDFYIIPLAKKLKECGVFGVSSDEYLSYAQQNRKEWEERGEEVVAEMIQSAKRKKVADRLFSMQQDFVDEEGQQIIEDMTKSMRRRCSAPPIYVTAALDQGTDPTSQADDDSSEFDLAEDFDVPMKD